MWIIAISLVVAIARVFVRRMTPTGVNVYKALAHVWVGGLFGAWFAGMAEFAPQAVGLTVWEVVCFALFKIADRMGHA